MKKGVDVKSYRSPSEEPPPGYPDPDLWFQTQYEITCEGRTYYAWAYEAKPGTINVVSYAEGGKARRFASIPYRDPTFCRVARHLISTLHREVIVRCEHTPLRVEARRLKP